MRYFLFLFGFAFLVSCQSDGLSVKQAQNLVADYIENYPVYESENIRIGEVKLSYRKDADKIRLIQQLADEGYLSVEEFKNKKKFLSKDSLWVSTIGLERPASKYVITQKKNKVELQTYRYVLQEDSEVSLKMNRKNKATVTAKLIKEPTPFAGLGKDKNPNTTFITRGFDLKYHQDRGWEVK